MNTCSDEMEEPKKEELLQLAISLFFSFLIAELFEEFWLRSSFYYSVNTLWYVFAPPVHC